MTQIRWKIVNGQGKEIIDLVYDFIKRETENHYVTLLEQLIDSRNQNVARGNEHPFWFFNTRWSLSITNCLKKIEKQMVSFQSTNVILA
jgi:hypothetical protein